MPSYVKEPLAMLAFIAVGVLIVLQVYQSTFLSPHPQGSLITII